MISMHTERTSMVASMRFSLTSFAVLLLAGNLQASEVVVPGAQGREVERYEINEKGLKNGLYRSWYPDTGILREESSYNNGLPHGNSVTWRSDGSMLNKCTYENGKIVDSDTYFSRYRLYTLEWVYLKGVISEFNICLFDTKMGIGRFDSTGKLISGSTFDLSEVTATSCKFSTVKNSVTIHVESNWDKLLVDLGTSVSLPMEQLSRLDRTQKLESFLASRVEFSAKNLEFDEAIEFFGRLNPEFKEFVSIPNMPSNKLINLEAAKFSRYEWILRLASEGNLKLLIDSRPGIQIVKSK